MIELLYIKYFTLFLWILLMSRLFDALGGRAKAKMSYLAHILNFLPLCNSKKFQRVILILVWKRKIRFCMAIFMFAHYTKYANIYIFHSYM